jgi:hypothetical protein
MKLICCILPDYSEIKSELDSKKNTENMQTWRINILCSVCHWKKEGNFKIPRTEWKWKHNLPEPLKDSKGNSKREIYGYESLY